MGKKLFTLAQFKRDAATGKMGLQLLERYGKKVEDRAKDLLTTELAVEYIAEKEDIIVSEKEYEEKTTELAAMYGETSVEGFVQSYESIYGEGYIKRMMLQEKVAAFLLKHAK